MIIVIITKKLTIFLWQWKVIIFDIYLENYILSSDICAINSFAADIQEIFAKSHHVFHTDAGKKTLSVIVSLWSVDVMLVH